MKNRNFGRPAALAIAAFAGAILLAILLWPGKGRHETAPPVVPPSALMSVAVRVADGMAGTAAEGVVEAVRQATLSAQVAGSIAYLPVKAGDRVVAGQLLARIDARAATQASQASEAQAQAAQASLAVALQAVTRQRQLREKGFISAAALDQAEAEFKVAKAMHDAQLAQAAVSRTQADFHVVRAPYGGIVSEVPVVEGDMAMPGRPLMTLYDPAAMRVSATLAQSDLPAQIHRADFASHFRIAIAGRDGAPLTPSRATLIPATDPNTQTLRLRLDLPTLGDAPVPGTFARVLLDAGRDGAGDGRAPRLRIPVSALLRRGELAAVYVIVDGQPRLRQVRPGVAAGDEIEVLAGLNAGEAIAVDAQAAARSARS